MADISISVNQESGLFTITLDKWEWQSLTVNGQAIPALNQGNVQFQWVQTAPGPVNFTATANQNIVIVNPGQTLLMSNSAKTQTYIGILSYAATNVVVVKGYLASMPDLLPDSKPSPLQFSQSRMTGHFVTTN